MAHSTWLRRTLLLLTAAALTGCSLPRMIDSDVQSFVGDTPALTWRLARSRSTRRYLLGQDEVDFDLMSWNADVTRMPAAMHSEYLRRCYLRNELAESRYPVEGRPV